MVTAYLLFHGRFALEWCITEHCPHRFDAFFEAIDGIDVENSCASTATYNWDPELGPHCYFWIPSTLNFTVDRVRATFEHIMRHLTCGDSPSVPSFPAAFHYRKFHHSTDLEPDEFARKCREICLQRQITELFGMADHGRSIIRDLLSASGILVHWGESSELDNEFDRGLPETLSFIRDALILNAQALIISSTAHSTVTDLARAREAEVIAFSARRDDSDYWTKLYSQKRPMANDWPL